MTTTQKWENLVSILIAREEHKDNNMYIECINLIMYIQETFMDDLRQIIHNKIEEYNNHRKTMLLPDFNEIIEERNYETDCPVCFETMYEGDKNCCMTGFNCEHPICMNCYYIIESDNNKCPICRKDLVNNITEVHFETDDENTDDEEEELWNGSNERPTNNLFDGRRWYNVETNSIECYITSSNRWITDINFTDCFNSGVLMDGLNSGVRNFIHRFSRIIDDDNYNCNCCGIQKTREVNEYIINAYNGDLSLEEYDERDWMDAFDDDDGCRTICFDCQSTYLRIDKAFYNRRN